MNLKKLSEAFLRARICASVLAVGGVLIAAFASVQILGRVWAHVKTGILGVPGLGAVAALLLGGALLGAAAIVQRFLSPARTSANE